MKEFYAFAGEHPILTFFLAWIVAWVVCHFGNLIFNRTYRAIKVLVRGWPPSHLDADGDWKPDPE